ncbi:MAG: hypothetical protein CME06_02975 [Gemmatimonadetes bacterium]|nr:hypothetical protein [Gemmatimonadota bacterium]
MKLPSSADPLATLLRSEDPDIDLPRAALLVEADHAADFDMEATLESYREFVAGATRELSGDLQPIDIVRTLNHYFFVHNRMRGNTVDYYDPRNCFLSQVLCRGLGIAATFAIPYLGALREAGHTCHPVILPGQLVLRVGADLFVDLFDGGQVFDTAEALRKARQTIGGKVMAPHEPAPLTNKDLALRILRTLKRAYRRSGDADHALVSVIRLLQATPGRLPEIRDRGMLHHDLGHWWRAVDDLSRYLARTTEAHDTYDVQSTLAHAYDLAIRLN